MKFPKILSLLVLAVGCTPEAPPENSPVAAANPNAPPKVRKLANSEYPSWQVFDVAHKLGYIDKTQGKMGPLEAKYNIDLVLNRADYTETINMYGSGAVDAVTITNTDILAPAMSREAVAIFPTSTSQGADACLIIERQPEPRVTEEPRVTDVNALVRSYLQGKKIRGAQGTVSEFAAWRCLGQYGLTSKDVEFTNMDPGAAAAAMIQGQEGFDAIMVWEPFVEDVLKKKKGTKILFDSKSIPGEIVDMVVMGKDAYESEGGKEFAALLREVFYGTCTAIQKSDEALTQLGEEFSHLTADEMRVIHNPADTSKSKCKFYGTAQEGLAVFTSPQFASTMTMISQYSKDRDIIKAQPTVRYMGTKQVPKQVPEQAGSKPVNLTFLTEVMSETK